MSLSINLDLLKARIRQTLFINIYKTKTKSENHMADINLIIGKEVLFVNEFLTKFVFLYFPA